jgi:hypothetical protein
MSSNKNRLRELERGNQRMEVLLSSLTFDTRGDAACETTRTATFHCEGAAYEIARNHSEDHSAFARRAEAEGIDRARADRPNAMILGPGAEDL